MEEEEEEKGGFELSVILFYIILFFVIFKSHFIKENIGFSHFKNFESVEKVVLPFSASSFSFLPDINTSR